jgi:hypothetical protein
MSWRPTRGTPHPGVIRLPNPAVEPVESDKRSYTSFIELGGRFVALDEVRARLRELQLDMVLGVLARISAHHARDGDGFFAPQNQGLYLAYAIADDFPAILPGAAKMYVPNRVPITGNRHTFIHEHGLAALSQLALLHCRTDRVTDEFSLPDFGHVCRILLILNDHLFIDERISPLPTLSERRRFAVNSLYYYQFNQLSADLSGHLALARLHQLLTVHLPNHLPRLDQDFCELTNINVGNYLLVAALLLTHVQHYSAHLTATESPWTSIDTFVSPLRSNTSEVRLVLQLFSQSPDDFRRAMANVTDDIFDFDVLQRRPVIEARPGQMLWPATSLLLRQILSFPLQVVTQLEQGRRALGNAYEDYAHTLVSRIAAGDKHGRWQPVRNHSVKVKRGGASTTAGEIDSLLWRDGTVVLFEHKAGNLMLTLGSRATLRNALGPTDVELDRLPAIPRKDGGVITTGLWQLARLAPAFDASMVKRFGASPKRVLSMLTSLQSFEIDDWVRGGYLVPLLSAANVRFPQIWSAPDWVPIVALEALAQLADDRGVDLLALLSERTGSSGRFTRYLADNFSGIPADMMLLPVAERLVKASRLRYVDSD